MTSDPSNPDYIWSVSPLDFAAADRIIRTNGLPLKLSDAEHLQLCTALAAIALLALEVAARPKWPKGLGATIARSYTALLVAMAEVQNFPGAPPPAPVEWLVEMNAWLSAAIDSHPETLKGSPVKEVDHIVYPKLLGIYRVAYGKEPAGTAGGPTERFIAAFLDTMVKVMRTLKWDGDPAVIQSIPNLVQVFARPTSAALCQRIRTFRNQIEDALIREMMREYGPRLAKSGKRMH